MHVFMYVCMYTNIYIIYDVCVCLCVYNVLHVCLVPVEARKEHQIPWN